MCRKLVFTKDLWPLRPPIDWTKKTPGRSQWSSCTFSSQHSQVDRRHQRPTLSDRWCTPWAGLCGAFRNLLVLTCKTHYIFILVFTVILIIFICVDLLERFHVFTEHGILWTACLPRCSRGKDICFSGSWQWQHYQVGHLVAPIGALYVYEEKRWLLATG